jgi:hypothetical protein
MIGCIWRLKVLISRNGRHEFFHQLHSKAAPKRADIATWFDLLDLDDYVSFGGEA